MNSYDILIKNGFIVDGTGKKGFIGDIAIKNDTIEKISIDIVGDATKVIDAKGCVVSPGLIDPHVHEETVVLTDRDFEVFLKQGVTTIINGNCGHSVTPGGSSNVFDYFYLNGLITSEARDIYNEKCEKWSDLKSYREMLKNKGININMGFLLGHGTIRWTVMNGSKDRKPTPEEEKEILNFVEQGMQQGAMGISTGLSYIPSRYADTDEIVECAKVVQKYDGVYATHARYYAGILESTQEAIEIGKRSGARVQVSHLTPSSVESYDAVLAAYEEGMEIAIDTIPRSTGHCTRKDRLIQFIMALSSELFDKGVEGVKKALQEPEGRAIVLRDAYIFGSDMTKLLMINTGNPDIEGKSIQQIADERGMEDPKELILDFLADDNDNYTFWLGGPSREDFPDKTHHKNILENPLVMVGSDTIFGETWDPGSWYELQRRGAFPIFANMYLDAGVNIEEIIRRNTSLPAHQFRLKDRGILKAGMKADISVINYDEYSYRSLEELDYSDPLVMADGVKFVLVNGEVALEDGNLVKSYNGEVL